MLEQEDESDDGDQLQNSDMSNHSESSDENDENYYLCKNKVTKWCKNPCVSKFAKTPSRNLLKLLPGPRNNASHIKDELQAFLLLIIDEMIEEIVG